mmetsp:Transcript_27360/g.69603  ORF Transcript_27360/g.69603 Transcript_27360/m.69603 type:complete len:621 (-) Transcript_27360:36-1898(-)
MSVFVDVASLDCGAFERLFRCGDLFERQEAHSSAGGTTNHAANKRAEKGDCSQPIWEATSSRSARGVSSSRSVSECSNEVTRRANTPFRAFSRHRPMEIGRSESGSPPVSSRISLGSSTYAHAVAAGAYSLAFEALARQVGGAVEDSEEDELARVAQTLRNRAVADTTWDEPVRVHTEVLGAALGIDWAKYLSRIDTQRAQARKGLASPPSSERGSTPSTRGSSRGQIYTRDGRKVDMSLRSEQEAALIERVQGHATMGAPSASHHSVTKYIGGDGTPGITPRSTTITPRSISLTPRASGATPRANSATPRNSSTPRSTSSHGTTPRRGATPRSLAERARRRSHDSDSTPRGSAVERASMQPALSPASFGLQQSAPPLLVAPVDAPEAGAASSDAAAAVAASSLQPAATMVTSARGAKLLSPKDKSAATPRSGPKAVRMESSPRKGAGVAMNSTGGSGCSSARCGSEGNSSPGAARAGGTFTMAEREAMNKEKLEAGMAAARAKRQALSRPQRQALASKIDSAAMLASSGHEGESSFKESEEWRDATFKRTHINYSAVLLHRSRATSHSLQDLRASALSVPRDCLEGEAAGPTSSVAVGQGSVHPSAALAARGVAGSRDR